MSRFVGFLTPFRALPLSVVVASWIVSFLLDDPRHGGKDVVTHNRVITRSGSITSTRLGTTLPANSQPGETMTEATETAVEIGIGAESEESWQLYANCLGVDPDLFFPERGASTKEAKAVCRACVVREDCLEYALENSEKFGIWGGLSERERRKLRRARALARAAQANRTA
jgi:WhiB family redox-sensing transcriptional regulator